MRGFLMAFCTTCGKVKWSPVGCKCAPPREPGQLRAEFEAARERARAREAADAAFLATAAPVQPTLPDRPSLRDLVREERARRTDT